MASTIKEPETRGDDATTLDSGKGVMERELEKHAQETDPTKPQLFRMKTRLPREGRSAALLAATDRMWINLKAYAEGGENTLHGHTNEDHSFIVLQGRATFYGPDGEVATLGKHEGIMLPRRCLYRFHAEPGEPLVILRMGCIVDPEHYAWDRIGKDGKPLPGSSKENKSTPTVFYEDRIFE